jgi:hypothetical protein
MLILVLVWAGLVVLLWAGSVWFQGYIYSEPSPQLSWSAPVAGTALALFFALWCWIDYHSPGRYTDLFHFSPREDHEPFTELWAVKGGNSIRYTLTKDAQGQTDYRDQSGKPIPTHPDRITVKEGGEEVIFEPERDANGNYKTRTESPLSLWPSRQKSLLYHDASGREMSEGRLGQLSTFHRGILLASIFLNTFHLALWFVCLWLLLRFQWSHALGLAVIFWLISTVLIVPTLLAKVETAAQSPPTAYHGVGDTTTRYA